MPDIGASLESVVLWPLRVGVFWECVSVGEEEVLAVCLLQRLHEGRNKKEFVLLDSQPSH